MAWGGAQEMRAGGMALYMFGVGDVGGKRRR